jgi:hypothetical protein
VAAVLGGAGFAILAYQHEKWARAKAIEMKREAERVKRELMREHLRATGEEVIFWRWRLFVDVGGRPVKGADIDPRLEKIIEPDWYRALKATGPSTEELESTVISPRFCRFLDRHRGNIGGAGISVDVDTGKGSIELRFRLGKERPRVVIPVVRVGDVNYEKSANDWFLARAPLEFPDGEPEWPQYPVVRRLTITMLRDGSLEIAYEGEPEVFPAKLEEFVDEPGRFYSGVDRPIVEIKADPATPHDKVTALVEALAKARVTDVTMRTE